MPQGRREDDEQETNGEHLAGRVSSCASRWWSGRRRRRRWGAYEGKSDDCFETCHVGLAGAKRARGLSGVWMADGQCCYSGRRRVAFVAVAVADRRFGGLAVDRQAKSGELWPVLPVATERVQSAASRPCHSIIGCKHIHIHIFTLLVCPA